MSLLSFFSRPPYSPPADRGNQPPPDIPAPLDTEHDAPPMVDAERDVGLPDQTEHANTTAAPPLAPHPAEPPPLPGTLSRLYGGLATLTRPVIQTAHWMFPTYLGNASATADRPSDFFAPGPRPSLYHRHCSEAQALANEIRQALRALDVRLRNIDPDHTPVMPPTLHAEPPLTWGHTAWHWTHRAQALATVTTSNLGQSAIAAGLLLAISVATSSVLASLTALLGAGYLCGRALQNVPSQLNQETAALTIRRTLADIRPAQRKLERLLQEEIIRKNAMERVVTVLAEHAQYIRELEDKLIALVAALDTVCAIPANATPTSQTDTTAHTAKIGDGQQRRCTCALLARTQQAFEALFSSLTATLSRAGHHISVPVSAACQAIGHGLSRAGQVLQHILSIPGTLLEQRAASQAELAYQNGAGKTLIQTLIAPTHDPSSIVNASYRAARDHYRDACGFAPPQAEIRNQLYMGERIAQALMHSAEPTPGVVAFDHHGEPMTAPANLTTVRALAWYFDAAADIPATTRPASVPVVQRLPDQRLLIADPDGRFYDFLMHAPTAYTRSMVDTRTQHDAASAGVFQLHDHCAGFPRGNRGVQFERVLDKTTGAFALALHMGLQQTRDASGIAPDIIALRDDNHIANRACDAPPVHPANPSELATDDYRNLSQDELQTAIQLVTVELEYYLTLVQGEHQQLQRLENWENPNF